MDSSIIKSYEDLLARYYEGDIKSFEILWGRLGNDLYNFAIKLTSNQNIAEDLCHFAWESILSNDAKYANLIAAGGFKLKSYMIRMIRNRYIDEIRKHGDDAELLEEDLPGGGNPLGSSELEEAYSVIEKCLEKLSYIYKEVFILIKVENMSLADVAEMLGIKLETAKTRRRESYKHMDTCLEANYGKL
jgi:RNA polymerase sigma factor (sigma-70 family)